MSNDQTQEVTEPTTTPEAEGQSAAPEREAPKPAAEPADPTVAGTLLPVELMQLNSLQQQAGARFNKMGQAVYELIGQAREIDQIEAQGQHVLNGIRDRLGIAEGTPWQVTPDGKARLLTNVVKLPGQRPKKA